MSLRAAINGLAKRVGLVAGATETCPGCGQRAPQGTSQCPADGPTADARNVPHCPQCRLPVEAEGLIVRRYARGYRVNAKVVDLR